MNQNRIGHGCNQDCNQGRRCDCCDQVTDLDTSFLGGIIALSLIWFGLGCVGLYYVVKAVMA